MTTPSTKIPQPPATGGRPLTGRMVLVWFVAFFGVIFAVNGVMVRAAISSFGGVETASSYQAGLDFGREEDAAARQDALGWRINAHVADGDFRLEARDANGTPVTGLDLAVTLRHPTDRRLDVSIDATPAGAGLWRAAPNVPAGQWELAIELTRDGTRMFRSINRVVTR